MAKQKNTIIYLIAALLFLGGVGYLVYSGLSESSVYFLNVSEAQAADQATLKNVRLFGTVSPKDLKRSDNPGLCRSGPDPSLAEEGRHPRLH